MTELSGANVVITGAASGLGRLMAVEIARKGASVSLWDLDEENLEAVVRDIKRDSGRARAVVCDVTNRGAVYEFARDMRPVDVLINNAGVVNGKNLLDIDDKEIIRSMEVNALSVFWMLKAFLPKMIERNRGHVVTIASAAGLIGVPRLSDYCASKFAAVGLDESLRAELKRTAPGVKTTIVCPYYTDTGMFEGVRTRFSFLLPILKQDRVVSGIVRAIERDRASLQMPFLVRSIPLLRILPTPWFDAVARMMGISASMDAFVGRSGPDA